MFEISSSLHRKNLMQKSIGYELTLTDLEKKVDEVAHRHITWYLRGSYLRHHINPKTPFSDIDFVLFTPHLQNFEPIIQMLRGKTIFDCYHRDALGFTLLNIRCGRDSFDICIVTNVKTFVLCFSVCDALWFNLDTEELISKKMSHSVDQILSMIRHHQNTFFPEQALTNSIKSFVRQTTCGVTIIQSSPIFPSLLRERFQSLPFSSNENQTSSTLVSWFKNEFTDFDVGCLVNLSYWLLLFADNEKLSDFFTQLPIYLYTRSNRKPTPFINLIRSVVSISHSDPKVGFFYLWFFIRLCFPEEKKEHHDSTSSFCICVNHQENVFLRIPENLPPSHFSISEDLHMDAFLSNLLLFLKDHQPLKVHKSAWIKAMQSKHAPFVIQVLMRLSETDPAFEEVLIESFQQSIQHHTHIQKVFTLYSPTIVSERFIQNPAIFTTLCTCFAQQSSMQQLMTMQWIETLSPISTWPFLLSLNDFASLKKRLQSASEEAYSTAILHGMKFLHCLSLSPQAFQALLQIIQRNSLQHHEETLTLYHQLSKMRQLQFCLFFDDFSLMDSWIATAKKDQLSFPSQLSSFLTKYLFERSLSTGEIYRLFLNITAIFPKFLPEEEFIEKLLLVTDALSQNEIDRIPLSIRQKLLQKALAQHREPSRFYFSGASLDTNGLIEICYEKMQKHHLSLFDISYLLENGFCLPCPSAHYYRLQTKIYSYLQSEHLPLLKKVFLQNIAITPHIFIHEMHTKLAIDALTETNVKTACEIFRKICSSVAMTDILPFIRNHLLESFPQRTMQLLMDASLSLQQKIWLLEEAVSMKAFCTLVSIFTTPEKETLLFKTLLNRKIRDCQTLSPTTMDFLHKLARYLENDIKQKMIENCEKIEDLIAWVETFPDEEKSSLLLVEKVKSLYERCTKTKQALSSLLRFFKKHQPHHLREIFTFLQQFSDLQIDDAKFFYQLIHNDESLYPLCFPILQKILQGKIIDRHHLFFTKEGEPTSFTMNILKKYQVPSQSLALHLYSLYLNLDPSSCIEKFSQIEPHEIQKLTKKELILLKTILMSFSQKDIVEKMEAARLSNWLLFFCFFAKYFPHDQKVQEIIGHCLDTQNVDLLCQQFNDKTHYKELHLLYAQRLGRQLDVVKLHRLLSKTYHRYKFHITEIYKFLARTIFQPDYVIEILCIQSEKEQNALQGLILLIDQTECFLLTQLQHLVKESVEDQNLFQGLLTILFLHYFSSNTTSRIHEKMLPYFSLFQRKLLFVLLKTSFLQGFSLSNVHIRTPFWTHYMQKLRATQEKQKTTKIHYEFFQINDCIMNFLYPRLTSISTSIDDINLQNHVYLEQQWKKDFKEDEDTSAFISACILFYELRLFFDYQRSFSTYHYFSVFCSKLFAYFKSADNYQIHDDIQKEISLKEILLIKLLYFLETQAPNFPLSDIITFLQFTKQEIEKFHQESRNCFRVETAFFAILLSYYEQLQLHHPELCETYQRLASKVIRHELHTNIARVTDYIQKPDTISLNHASFSRLCDHLQICLGMIFTVPLIQQEEKIALYEKFEKFIHETIQHLLVFFDEYQTHDVEISFILFLLIISFFKEISQQPEIINNKSTYPLWQQFVNLLHHKNLHALILDNAKIFEPHSIETAFRNISQNISNSTINVPETPEKPSFSTQIDEITQNLSNLYVPVKITVMNAGDYLQRLIQSAANITN